MVIMVIIKEKMLMLAIDEIYGRMFLTSWYFYANACGIASVPFEIMQCIYFPFSENLT